MSETLRRELAALVRFPLAPPAPPAVLAHDEERHDGFVVERLTFASSSGEPMRGVLARPDGLGPHPVVLYCHAHGARYDIGAVELLDGRPSLVSPYGPVLARAGFVVLCVEMPAFGTRATPGESARAKARLWFGDTLFGEMLRDLALGLAHLRARPDIDPCRIATLGLSMGATHAFWMAALDPGIARAAHLCCYADLATLVRSGAHDRHGHYMTVPGLLERFPAGRICGLVAPRPQLIAVGLRDALTPPDAVSTALAQTRAAYREAGAEEALVVVQNDDTGHVETADMRDAVLRCLTLQQEHRPRHATIRPAVSHSRPSP